MSDAIRTILECIGEDPSRDGLLKTPERYAKALLWMTKGYEEKLSGRCKSRWPNHNVVTLTLVILQRLLEKLSLQRITKKWSSFVTSTSSVFVNIISSLLSAKYGSAILRPMA